MTRLLMRVAIFMVLLSPVSAWSDATGLEEANADFTYHQQPIYPGLIQSFQNWMSDYRPPMTVTVDVGAAFDSNQYGGEPVEIDKEGRVSMLTVGGGEFSYHHLGRVAGNIHVLKTWDWGGGTGTFLHLMFVRFAKVSGYDRDGLKPSDRLMMSVVRLYSLRVAKGVDIELKHDGVAVKGNGETVNLDFKEPVTGLANPASVNCAKKGGTLESRKGEKGTSSYCHLPNGKICEEGSFFRGTCS